MISRYIFNLILFKSLCYFFEIESQFKKLVQIFEVTRVEGISKSTTRKYALGLPQKYHQEDGPVLILPLVPDHLCTDTFENIFSHHKCCIVEMVKMVYARQKVPS